VTCRVGAYVISLEREARSPHLIDELRAAGAEVTLVRAIRGSLLSDNVKSGFVDQWGAWWHSGARLSAAQIGCALSHRLAYEQARRDGVGWAVIAEDDAICLPGLRAWLDDLSEWSPEEPTVLTFLSTGRYLPDGRRSPIRLAAGSRVAVPLRWAPASAVMYAMNSAALRVALSDSSPLFTRADWPPWSNSVTFYIAQPMPIYHNAGSSTIDGAQKQSTGAARSLRALAKLSGINFLMAPRPYRGRVSQYWKHSLFPSLDWTLRKRSKTASGGDAL
jgi:GR25 family glycosyltransferase involved in LPS biosynthesis